MAETDFMMVVVMFAGIFIFRLHRRYKNDKFRLLINRK